jgi:hypothetical protein
MCLDSVPIGCHPAVSALSFANAGKQGCPYQKGSEWDAGQTRENPRVVALLHRTTMKNARVSAAAQMTGWTQNSRDLGCETIEKKPPTVGEGLQKQQVGFCQGVDTG